MNKERKMTDYSFTAPNSQYPVPKCIILAAGASTRLRPLTDSKPKCLLEVGGKTLLERTIGNVLETGIREVAVVTGYHAEMVRSYIKEKFPKRSFRFILNSNYDTTNNAYSLLLARSFLENKDSKIANDLLLLDSDILFSSKIIQVLLQDYSKNKVAVRVPSEYDEEEMRVKVNYGKSIVQIGKNVPLTDTYGESIGIELFSAETAERLFAILEQRVRNGKGRSEFYEAAFQEMIDNGIELKAIDVSAFPAIEIDTLDDLDIAGRMSLDLVSPKKPIAAKELRNP